MNALRQRTLITLMLSGVFAMGAATCLVALKRSYDAAYIPMAHAAVARRWPRVGQSVADLAFSQDDRLLAASDTQYDLHILRVPRLRETLTIPTQRRETITTLAWTAGGARVLAGDAAGVNAWNVSTRSSDVLIRPNVGTRSIQGSPQEARYLVSPSGEFAAGGRDDTTLSIWNLKARRTLHVSIPEAVRSAAVPAPWDDPTSPWERAQVKFPLVALAFSPDSRRLAIGFVRYHPSFPAMHLTVCLFDTATGQLIRSWLWRDSAILVANSGDAALAFSPDGSLLAGRDDGKIALWDAGTGVKRRVLTCARTSGGLKWLAFVPGAPLFASVALGNNIEVWNAKTSLLAQTFHGARFTQSLAVSHDGRLLASGGQTAAGDGVVDLWDISWLR